MLLQIRLAKTNQASAKIQAQIQELESTTIRQELKDRVLPLLPNELLKIHDDLRDYQFTLLVNDGYNNREQWNKIGKVADTVLELHFNL